MLIAKRGKQLKCNNWHIILVSRTSLTFSALCMSFLGEHQMPGEEY